MSDEKYLINCKNCDWTIPNELVENLLKDIPIFCEKCGFSYNKNDYDIIALEKALRQEKKKTDTKLLKTTGRKVYKKVRTKLSNLRQKGQDK